MKSGNDEQIQYVPESSYATIESVDAVLSFRGASNTKGLSSIEPEKFKLLAQGLTKYKQLFYDKEAKGKLRWCVTLFPTVAFAQEANMSYSEYCDFVYEACGILGDKDPVSVWKKVQKEQKRICDIP